MKDAPAPQGKSFLSGVLLAYYEQGWEGAIRFAFQPDNSNLPIFLSSGQHLTVFDDDGAVLWSGKLHFVRRGWRDQHRLGAGIWSDCKQKGVSYAQWMDWFWRQPPLRAALADEDGA